MPFTAPVKINIVFVGPSKAGKTAICKILSANQFPEHYDPTHGADYRVCCDPEHAFKFAMWDLGGDDRVAVTIHFLKNVDILVFVINPLDENYALQQKKFLTALSKQYNVTPRYGYLVLFSHYDLWDMNLEVVARFEAFKREFSLVATARINALAVSAKNLERNKVLNAFLEIIKPLELRVYCQRLMANINKFVKTSQNRLLFKSHLSRLSTVRGLKLDVIRASTQKEVCDALIAAAMDIRTPDFGREEKFGFSLFGKHFRSYKDSGLYKLVKKELAFLAPQIDLEAASEPKNKLEDIDLENEYNSFMISPR